MLVSFSIIQSFILEWLMKIDLSPYDPYNNFFKKEDQEKQKVTFIVDMSEQVVEYGEGESPAVYVSAGIGDSPSGLEMINKSFFEEKNFFIFFNYSWVILFFYY